MAARQFHPLQRLSSPSRSLSLLLHLAGLVSFSSSFRYLAVTPNPINDSYGWHLQFLTIIGLALSYVTFAIGLLADVTLSAQLFSLKNALTVVSAPLEVLISLLYWSLRSIDPKLVVPEFAPPIAPIADIGFHLVPALAILVDILFFSPPWTITVVPALGISSLIAIGYWFWVDICYQQNGFYPYPIFEQAGYNGRIALFAGSAVVMTVSTLLLRTAYSGLNNRPIARPKKA